MTFPNTNPSTPANAARDPFYPSGRFARVPAEALGALALSGPHAIGHASFRVLVALCRFRGASGVVNPSQETLAEMTGLSRNNVSRAVHDLAKRGWLRLEHLHNDPHKRITNYELTIPVVGESPGVPQKVSKAQRNAAKRLAAELKARPVLFSSKGVAQPGARAGATAAQSEYIDVADEIARDLAAMASSQ